MREKELKNTKMNLNTNPILLLVFGMLAVGTVIMTPAFAQKTAFGNNYNTTQQQQPLTNATNTNTTTTTNATNCKVAPKYYDSPPSEPLFTPSYCNSNTNTTSPAQTTTTTPQTTTTTIPNTIDSLRQQTAPPGSTITTPEGNTMQAPTIDEATKAQMAATDPYFARFVQISELCSGAGLGQAQMTSQQCVDSLQTGADRWCGLEFYDSLKCQYATNLVRAFGNLNNVLNSYGFDKIPDISSLLNGP